VVITKRDYIYKIDFDYLIRFASETKIYRNYRKYFTKDDFVRALLGNLKKEQCESLYTAFKDGISPEKIAQEYVHKNPTSEIIKEKLVDRIIKEKEKDDVIFFEFPVLGARTDVTRINENSYNYEIKTGRDKIIRLKEQMDIFIKFFEQNSVVCPIEVYDDVLEYLPSAVGVIVYEILENDISFREGLPSKKSFSISSEDQLKIITVEGLRKIYNKEIGHPNKLKRKELMKDILSYLDNNEINEQFKLYLKGKYFKKECVPKSF